MQELPDWELGGLGSLDDEDLLGEDPLDLPFTFGAGPPAGVGRESVRVSSGLYKARQGALLRQVSTAATVAAATVAVGMPRQVLHLPNSLSVQVSPDQGASQAPGPSPGTDSSSGRGTSSTRGGSSGRGGEGGKPKRVRVRNAEQQAKNKVRVCQPGSAALSLHASATSDAPVLCRRHNSDTGVHPRRVRLLCTV